MKALKIIGSVFFVLSSILTIIFAEKERAKEKANDYTIHYYIYAAGYFLIAGFLFFSAFD